MSAPAITVDQGAALLWLRRAGGLAHCDHAGNVSFGRANCPLVFANFNALERRGLVTMRLHGDVPDSGFEVLLVEAGTQQPIDPAAERRLDQLMRRFDD